MESETPLFDHDCDRCTFLGRFKGSDLYFCNQSSNRPTVIARHSSDGRDYTSGIVFADTIEELGEAKRRATKLQLL